MRPLPFTLSRPSTTTTTMHRLCQLTPGATGSNTQTQGEDREGARSPKRSPFPRSRPAFALSHDTHTHTNTHGGCDDDHQGGGGFPRFQSCSFSSSLPFSCSLLPSPCISPDSLPRSHSFSLAPSCLRKALGPLAVLLAYLMMGRRTLSQHSFPFG